MKQSLSITAVLVWVQQTAAKQDLEILFRHYLLENEKRDNARLTRLIARYVLL